MCQCVCPAVGTLTVAFLDRFSPKLHDQPTFVPNLALVALQTLRSRVYNIAAIENISY